MKGKGRYHECEIKLHSLYRFRRAQGLKVTYAWLSARMMQICRRDRPQGKNFDDYTGFKQGWCRRFCLRWNISLQIRTKKKTVSIYKRLHDIQAYHRKLLYDLQDPRNFGHVEDSETRPNWFSLKWYVENHRDPPKRDNDDNRDMEDDLTFSDSEISDAETER